MYILKYLCAYVLLYLCAFIILYLNFFTNFLILYLYL